MTIEEFLDENTYNLTPDEYNAALDDSQTMDEATWVATYAPLMQEKAVGWNKLDAVKKAKPLPERLREAFGKDGFNPGKTYKDDVFQDEFEGDVKREDFEKALSKMKEYYDQEVAQRKAEADKEKRKREVKNWNWLRDIATSDYEKERYIDDPQSALFGEQAPELGEAPKTRWGSAADLGLGVAGAAADALPGWGSMAGPAVRTARDVGHKVTGSPYQKEWGDIGKNLIADAGFSASTAWLPNFRKARRIESSGLMPKAISETVAIEKDAENMYKGASVLHELVNGSQRLEQFGDNVKDRYFRETVNDLPNSPLKAELLPLAKQQNIDWGKARAIVNNNAYWGMMGLNPETGKTLAHALIDEGVGIPQQVAKQVDAETIVKTGVPGGAQIPMATAEEIPEFVNRLYHAPKLTPFQQKTKPAWVMFDKFLSGDLGGAALQEAKTVTGARSPKKATRVETAEEREEIEAIKEREAPFWGMKFKPRKDNSLMYKAWKEWADENGVEVKD